MKRAFGWSWLAVVGGLGGIVAACSGSQGAQGNVGPAGTQGTPGTAASSTAVTPSVSVITPPYAFLDRTVDVTVAGSGTAWDSSATVGFADSNIKVNAVTAASPTGLVVNITVGAGAAVGPVNVSVTEGKSTVLYKDAFQVKAPLLVEPDPVAGVPQGGLANLHVVMQDLTTPFDPDTIAVTLSTPDVAQSQPSPTDYAYDLTIQADVLATPGTFDLTTTCGTGTTTVSSPAAQSFKVAARAPIALGSTIAAGGNLETPFDTELYKFTPAAASLEFVQFTQTSQAGTLAGTVIPKSGKYADALASGFFVRFAQGTTSTDPLYVVVGDSNGFFGPGPTPADTSLSAFQSLCTAATEIAETAAANDDTQASAQPILTLPALVSGALGYGTVDGTVDVDFYAITVTGAPATIHVATGGDPYTDALLAIVGSDGTTIATSPEDDLQKDLLFTATTAGTYYVTVSANNDPNTTQFSDSDNTYQLFIDVK
jgi:hypothetical protein